MIVISLTGAAPKAKMSRRLPTSDLYRFPELGLPIMEAFQRAKLNVFMRYTKYSQHEMNKALDLELKGDIEKCLTAIVKCASNRAAFFAEKLHEAMKGSGTRDKDLIRIMVSRSEIDMNEIKAQYQRLYGKSLHQAILDDTKGDYETILIALCGGK